MIQSNNKTTVYLFFLVWASLFFILFFLVLLPLFKDIDFLSSELLFQNRAIKLFDLRDKNINTFKKSYNLKIDEIKTLESVFISREAPINFIEFLEKEAADNNLEIKIKPLNINSIKNKNWQPIGFTVIVGGDFPNCLKFLDRLENNHWLVDILNLRMERISERNKNEVRGISGLKVGQARMFIELKSFINKKPNNKKNGIKH